MIIIVSIIGIISLVLLGYLCYEMLKGDENI